jgi:hypothetical protein
MSHDLSLPGYVLAVAPAEGVAIPVRMITDTLLFVRLRVFPPQATTGAEGVLLS